MSVHLDYWDLDCLSHSLLFVAGLHRGTAEKLPDGAVCVTLEWDEPLGGIGTDVFYAPAPKLLYVDSTILMHGQTVKYRTVYNKQQ